MLSNYYLAGALEADFCVFKYRPTFVTLFNLVRKATLPFHQHFPVCVIPTNKKHSSAVDENWLLLNRK
jgi:hypothetical protein